MAVPVVLGIDFGGTKIAAAVADPDGVQLGTVTIHSAADESADQTFRRALDAAARLLDEVAPDGELLAVGACTFGIPHEDRIELAPTIDGWGELPFGRELRRAFPAAELRMATDVKAAAQAEVERGALLGCNPGIYVNLGTGLAVAIVVDGMVLAGRHGAAGEIGYNARTVGARDDSSVLEDAVSGKALGVAARQHLGPAAGPIDLFAAAVHDDRAARLLDDFVTELAFHLVNLTIAIDPARVVVGGGLVRDWDRLAPPLRAALDAAVPFPPELVLAAFPFDAPLLGAIALAIGTVGHLRRQSTPA
jgi:glucokinase